MTRFREWSDARESRVRSSRVRQTHLPVVLAGVLPGTRHGHRAVKSHGSQLPACLSSTELRRP